MKLKFKYGNIAAFVALLALVAAGLSFSGSSQEKTQLPDGTFTTFAKEDQITKVWTHDTLTTTENDTLLLGFTLASPYQYSYQAKVQKISGTPSLKIVLDQRNSFSNSDWVGIDSVSVSGADSTKTYFLLRGANVYGLQHRIRLMGTTGINQYDITGLLKKTN